MDRLPPITPGELLQQEFLQPLGVSQYRLAKAIGVTASRNGILQGVHPIPQKPLLVLAIQ